MSDDNINIETHKHISEFITSNDILKRYQITQMTLWRWLRSENVKFPQPMYINNRRYFRFSDVMNWEKAKATEASGAAS